MFIKGKINILTFKSDECYYVPLSVYFPTSVTLNDFI